VQSTLQTQRAQFQLDFGQGNGRLRFPDSERLLAWDPALWPVADDWRPVIARFLAGAPAHRLEQFIRLRLAAGATIVPSQPFLALALTPLAEVKVVILGQDPYHGPRQAQGLAFSVAAGTRIPPSLRNILHEVERERNAEELPDVTHFEATHASPHAGCGSLRAWASQGVLLLNTCLTVELGRPASHINQGWEALTDLLIQSVCEKGSPLVFMLWGSQAQSKADIVARAGAGVPILSLTANHPSPLSARRPPAPFIGCGHFGRANAFLRQHGLTAIAW
jgi:uracil-DNA glycosylase